MADTVYQKEGRKWSVTSAGITTLKRKYVIALDGNNLGANGEFLSFTGLPSIGTAHPIRSGLFVQSYDIEEGEGKDKRTLTVYVNYAPNVTESGGSGEEAYNGAVTEWGWDAGTEEKELTTAADGTVVLNSAGDPFDSVPQISAPAPVFTKVMKFKQRQSCMDCNCKVNASDVTIGAMTCPAGSLLCTVAEKRLVGDADWMYQYTVQLKFKSNKVKLNGQSTLTDIGWDVSITDAGMREKDSSGKLKLIRQIDAETGKRCTVTSPELLNGQGAAVDRSSGTTPTPYNFRFKAYETTTFPSWFYSEPATT